MAVTDHKAYSQAATATLTTELNSLANAGTSAAGAAIDNTTARDLFADVELYVATQGTARSTGAVIELYMVMTLDGTNYGDAVRNVAELVAVFPLDAAPTARYVHRRDIPIPPASIKFFAYNGTGQALASSANTVKYRFHSIETV